MKPFTSTTAAHFLEITERAVREMVRDGKIEVVGKGPHGAKLLSAADVRLIARIHELGALGRRQKLVLVVGGSVLADQLLALRVAGLTPAPATGIMDALSQHDVAGAPIIVATPQAIHDEIEILRTVLGQVHLAFIGRKQTLVPWDIELAATMVKPDEHRSLVTWAWLALDARHEAGSLDL